MAVCIRLSYLYLACQKIVIKKNKSCKTEMKLSFLVLTMLVMLSIDLFSQNNRCNCLENLNKLVAKTEENYAGYPVKVNRSTFSKYKELVRSLEKRTSKVTDPVSCYNLLKAYVRFFKDKHFMLGFQGDKRPETESISLSEEAFRSILSKKKPHPMEGIWINAENTLKIAIRRKSKNEFHGIILATDDPGLPVGLVYYTFLNTEKGWIAQEFNSYLTTDIVVKQRGNLLQIWNQKMFGKIHPSLMSENERAELDTWKNDNHGLDFKKLSEKTAYLKIPSFKNNNDKILDLVTRNDAIIQSCENLIVDLTGNGGGSTGWVSFLPYFMTNPIIQYDTYLRVTPDNVNSKLSDLEPFAVNPIPDEYKKYFPEDVLVAYKKAYQELPVTQKSFYPIPGVTFPLDSILAKPKRIALMVDDLCGSSAEYFFFLSKQSKKTTTYGINTVGMMDYEGMSNPTALPYDKYILTIPIVKSSWTDTHPIDQTGFRPDILLNNVDQREWLEFVRKDLEGNAIEKN